MITHSIEHRFTPEDLAAAASAAAAIQQLFGFCTALEPQERHDLYKLGPGTESFATQMIALAQQHLDLLPRGLDVDELAARMETRETLRFYFETLQPLLLRMEHSIMLMGAQILKDTLKVYKTLKVNGQEAGLQEILAEIGKRFYTKKPKRKAKEEKGGTDGVRPSTGVPPVEDMGETPMLPESAPQQPTGTAKAKDTTPTPEAPSSASHPSHPSQLHPPLRKSPISPAGLFEHFSKPYDYFHGVAPVRPPLCP